MQCCRYHCLNIRPKNRPKNVLLLTSRAVESLATVGMELETNDERVENRIQRNKTWFHLSVKLRLNTFFSASYISFSMLSSYKANKHRYVSSFVSCNVVIFFWKILEQKKTYLHTVFSVFRAGNYFQSFFVDIKCAMSRCT